MAVHDAAPSLTVTSPVGAPLPGAPAATLYFTVTVWPTTEGSGSSDVIVVVVSARSTWCDATGEAGLAL